MYPKKIVIVSLYYVIRKILIKSHDIIAIYYNNNYT